MTKMKQPIENIQNRVRNHLGSFQTAVDILNVLKNALIENDQDQITLLNVYLKKIELLDNMQNQIDWFISLGAAMDDKIADKSFDVEKYIKELDRKK